MSEEIIARIAKELNITIEQVNNTLKLLEEDCTVPFIARYRKEATKGLDEEQILHIQKQYDYLQKLQERKENVLKLIGEQGKLTDEIRKAVMEGDVIHGSVMAGQIAGLVKEIRSCKDIVEGLNAEAESLLKVTKIYE